VAIRNLPPHKPPGSAAGDQQNKQDKSDREKQGKQGVSGLRMSDSHEESKQAPGSHVVDRRASEGQHADGSFLQALVREDASEHGKRGNGHGHADKERKDCQRDFPRSVERKEPERERSTEQERYDDARVRDGNGSCGSVAQKPCIEFKTDEEHIEHDANLRDQREVGRNCRGKDLGSQGRCQPTKERRTEQDSRDDFPYDSGLVEPAKECTEDARDDNNEDEGEQKVHQGAGGFGKCCDCGLRRLGCSRCDQ
jgi:hypothetical protein